MQNQQDSFSEEDYFEDDDYSPIIMGENDMENQAFIGEKDIKKLTHLSEKAMQFFKNYKKIPKSTFMKFFLFKEDVEQHKSVCAKPIERNQTIAQCYDCATDSTCIQCMDCFKNSNHEGHKVIIKKAYGGCCDCGDPQAWKKQGFCKKHTGESIEIEIDQKESEYFLTQMKQIFYLLFRECILQNMNFSRDFSNQILDSLRFMNSKGVYYNKLTCMLFGSKIPPQFLVSKNVNTRSVLTNLLSPRIAKFLDIDKWMDLFFSMFQYYPFKKLLLGTYMKNFSIIYGDEKGLERGSSISCQLLTSHKLVKDYTLQADSIPMGSNIKMDKMGQFDNTFYMLYHDLNYITKLQGDAPLVYFKFHTKTQQGILKLFEYRFVIKSQQDKYKQEPDILQLAKYTKYFQLQYKVLDLMTKITGILQHQKQHLLFIIKTLHDHALKQENEKKMIIFKPLTRALTIFIFAYFDLNVQNLNYEKNKQKIDHLINYIGNNQNSYANDITKLFKICAQTYLFHAKILAETGLNSTLYGYIYFYKLKNRIASCLDILSVKLFSLMHRWPQVNRQPLITPQDHIWSSSVIQENDTRKEQVELKIKHLQFLISQLNLVTASQSNELYMAYQINKDCGLYQEYIENVLQKILNQEKGNISLSDTKLWQQWFFHPNVNLAEKYMKKFCTYDKVKKAFIYRVVESEKAIKSSQQENSSPEFIDYNNFRCNLTNKSNFQSPELTLQLMRQSKGERVFDNLWTVQTIKKFVVKGVEYMKLLITAQGLRSNKQKVESNKMQSELSKENLKLTPSIIGKLKPMFDQIMKIVYLKKHIATSKPQQLQIITFFINKIQHIEKVINPFYLKFLHPQKMQQEGPILLTQKSQNNISSPKKEDLKKIKSSEEQRKLKIKEKMEQKKKALKQKYSQQTQKFQQQEKIKLQKQDKQQQLEHKQSCIICKNDDQQNLVFLVKITYKNHQKLLGLGQGVTCLSLSSCYHAIDYDCYRKLESQIKMKRRPMIKCPFCKIASNTFLPIKMSSKIIPQALKKFQGALFTQKNLEQVSILQQIIKSFYHFTLLAYLDPQKTLHRRLHIYKILFEILKNNTQIGDLQKEYEKFVNKKMNLNPKIMEQSYEKKRSQRLLEMELDFQNNSNINLEDMSESQIQQLMSIIYGQEDRDEDSQSSENSNRSMGLFFSSTINKLKDKMSKSKKKSKKQEQSNNQKTNNRTFLFQSTIKRLFNQLGMKEIEEQKKQKIPNESLEEQEEKMQQQESESMCLEEQRQEEKVQLIKEVPHHVQLCFKRLFDSNFVNPHNNIYEDLNDNSNLLKFRDLPLNFTPLGRCNKCDCCHQISSSMALCLLCNWQGCLKDCLNLKKNAKKEENIIKEGDKQIKQGGTFNHSKCHGQQSLFLILDRCSVANISTDGVSNTCGCIYKDEWGNNFNLKQAWQKFFLDEGELYRIKQMFLHQQ